MFNQPLAYFLTWSCYGSWLHGDARESVDRTRNAFGTARLDPDERARKAREKRLSAAPMVLDDVSRPVVHAAIIDHCTHRGWALFAVNVRTTHVHVVVQARDYMPEVVLDQLKAWSTRRMRDAGLVLRDAKVWTTHGSTIYIFDEVKLKEKVHYVLHEQ